MFLLTKPKLLYFTFMRGPKYLFTRLLYLIFVQNIFHRGCLGDFRCMRIEDNIGIVCNENSMELCQCMRSKYKEYVILWGSYMLLWFFFHFINIINIIRKGQQQTKRNTRRPTEVKHPKSLQTRGGN